MSIEKSVDDLITMNQSGRVLELCEKYYAENVLMLNNGAIFAESMKEAYDKQKGYIESVKEFDIKLVSKKIENDLSVLVFHYKMKTADSNVIEFTGKHTQKWENGKIIKEEYEAIDPT